MKDDKKMVLIADLGAWRSFLKDTKYRFGEYKNIDDLITLCKQKNIKYLFPIKIRNELFVIKHESHLRKKGYKFLTPTKNAITILNNKSKFTDFMIKNNLDEYIPKKYNTIQYPCIIKKNKSIFGKDGYVINSPKDIPKNIDLKDYLIQECILGNCEYSTDLLSKNGKIIAVSVTKYCYKKDLYIMGKQIYNPPTIINDITSPVLEAFSKIIKTLNYSGFCNIDYKIIDTGYPKIFEINPRCGGSLRSIPVEKFNNIMIEYIKNCE